MIKRYVLPIVIGLITVFIGFRLQYLWNEVYNDHRALHAIIGMIQSGQIHVEKVK